MTSEQLSINNEQLAALLDTHAAVLQPLLGPLWPVRPFEVKQFGPLTKYTLGQMPDERWAHLHRLAEPDHGDLHDHPCEIDSIGIENSYVELREEEGQLVEYLRQAGGRHTILPETRHRIIALPEGPCWTLVFTGPVVHEWQHYPEPEVPHSKYHSATTEAAFSG
jgi:hypothetical protein